MPPDFSHRSLSEAQKQTIRGGVAEGAKYEGHWAYQPVRRPEVPVIAGTDNPVDGFLMERLAREGLKPSPEAERRTLIRRVTLDLTGLPPSPKEVESVVKDPSPKAYSKVVAVCLASPHCCCRLRNKRFKSTP